MEEKFTHEVLLRKVYAVIQTFQILFVSLTGHSRLVSPLVSRKEPENTFELTRTWGL